MNNKALHKELKLINADMQTAENKLIKQLQTVGLEYTDLNQYLSLKSVLITRKSKVQYLIALNDIKSD